MGARRRPGKRSLTTVLLIGLTLAGGVGAPPPAGAAGECGTVLATGLANPRFVAVAADGAVYVSESGVGGDEAIPRPAALPQGPPVAPNRGPSGRVTRIGPGGTKTPVAANLTSYGPSEGASGPAGLVVVGDSLWTATGGAAALTPFIRLLPDELAVLRINRQTGAVAKVADLGAYELANNPDGFVVESNPFGLAVGPDGTVYVADGGANTLLRVNPATGQVTRATVFDGFPAPQPNPARGGRNEVDPVPTGVAVGADGAVYVALHRGGPPLPGGAKIVRVAPDGTVRDFATGLTFLGGLAFGPDRLLYAVEIVSGADPSTQPPTPLPGRVQRILPDGRAQVVAEGLDFPSGIAFDRAGNLYVATGTSSPRGQVLRCDRIAVVGLGLPQTGGREADAPTPGARAALLALTALLAPAAGAVLFLARRVLHPGTGRGFR